MAKCYFKAVKNNKNFDFFQNVISVATLIRAYLDEKPSEINTRSYMFIRKCRVAENSSKIHILKQNCDFTKSVPGRLAPKEFS